MDDEYWVEMDEAVEAIIGNHNIIFCKLQYARNSTADVLRVYILLHQKYMKVTRQNIKSLSDDRPVNLMPITQHQLTW